MHSANPLTPTAPPPIYSFRPLHYPLHWCFQKIWVLSAVVVFTSPVLHSSICRLRWSLDGGKSDDALSQVVFLFDYLWCRLNCLLRVIFYICSLQMKNSKRQFLFNRLNLPIPSSHLHRFSPSTILGMSNSDETDMFFLRWGSISIKYSGKKERNLSDRLRRINRS